MLTALLLKNAGLRVAVLESGEVCAATTEHTTAKVSAQHGLIYDTLRSAIDCDWERRAAYAYAYTDDECGSWAREPVERAVRSQPRQAARLGYAIRQGEPQRREPLRQRPPHPAPFSIARRAVARRGSDELRRRQTTCGLAETAQERSTRCPRVARTSCASWPGTHLRPPGTAPAVVRASAPTGRSSRDQPSMISKRHNTATDESG